MLPLHSPDKYCAEIHLSQVQKTKLKIFVMFTASQHSILQGTSQPTIKSHTSVMN